MYDQQNESTKGYVRVGHLGIARCCKSILFLTCDVFHALPQRCVCESRAHILSMTLYTCYTCKANTIEQLCCLAAASATKTHSLQVLEAGPVHQQLI